MNRKPIPDGQKCIICKQSAVRGAINHLKTCADYVKKAK